MGAQDDLGLVVHQIADGLEGLVNTLGVGNVAFSVKGDVKVAADKDLLAGYVDVFDGLLVEIIHDK